MWGVGITLGMTSSDEGRAGDETRAVVTLATTRNVLEKLHYPGGHMV